MKAILLILFLIPIQLFSQVNPWENKSTGKNPWGEKEKTKKVKKDTIPVVIVKLDSTKTQIIKTDSTTIETDKEVADTAKISNEPAKTEVKTELDQWDLELVRADTRQDFLATGTFVSAFFTSCIFNLYALPLSFGLTFATSGKEREYVNTYKTQHPTATSKEIKYVKKGLKSKKRGRAIGGALSGSLLQILLILAIFN